MIPNQQTLKNVTVSPAISAHNVSCPALTRGNFIIRLAN